SLVLSPVSGYVRAVAMGAFEFYGSRHDPIAFLCALVVITPLSFFLHLIFYSSASINLSSLYADVSSVRRVFFPHIHNEFDRRVPRGVD
ncbi:MAG: hypothetical protein LBD58_10265, partial [Treponema sp.]|nr:hypothetical protein [Treponema sp.]